MQAGEVVSERSFASGDPIHGPETIIAALRAHGPLDLVMGPAGYGTPLRRGDELSEHDLAMMLLVRSDEARRDVGVAGLRTLIRALAACELPVVFGPGAIHLPTVAPHRKRNRIDIGTADKVAAAASAIDDQAQRLGIPVAATSLIMLELGGAFTAALAVENGQVVDGLGGSSGVVGARACGALDGEVAYLLAPLLSKDTVFSGGLFPSDAPDVVALRGDPAFAETWLAYEEAAAKAVLTLTASVSHPREILLSGRISTASGLAAALAARLASVAPVRRGGRGAAHGAALIADGLSGGQHAPLVDCLRLREASGSVLDHIFLSGAGRIEVA
jgi:predicted butyrate kinase (DUF1464 family)